MPGEIDVASAATSVGMAAPLASGSRLRRRRSALRLGAPGREWLALHLEALRATHAATMRAAALSAVRHIEWDASLRDGGRQPSTCPICLEDFGLGEELGEIPGCCHLFHRGCVEPWLSGTPTCPMCRCLVVPGPCRVLLPASEVEHSLSAAGDAEGEAGAHWPQDPWPLASSSSSRWHSYVLTEIESGSSAHADGHGASRRGQDSMPVLAVVIDPSILDTTPTAESQANRRSDSQMPCCFWSCTKGVALIMKETLRRLPASRSRRLSQRPVARATQVASGRSPRVRHL